MSDELPKKWMLRCPKCNHLMPAAAQYVTGVEGKTMGRKVQSRCRKCENTVLASLEHGPKDEAKDAGAESPSE